MIKKECLFQTEYRNKAELFQETTDYLVSKGYVTPEFEQALNTREQDFPTGLPTTPAVAIPHTDGQFVQKDTILCIVNTIEIEFNEMGGDETDVIFPKVLFMLVLKEGQTHLMQLQNLIEKIQDGKLVSHILECQSIQEFESVIDAYL